MKLHYSLTHYNKKYRGQLFPLLKAFIKNDSFTDKERIAMYQISEKEVDFVEYIQEADLCILTMSWNYYLATDQYEIAVEYIKEANAAGRQVWTWMSGDFGMKLDLETDYLVFRHSGHRSQLPENHIGMPAFINDPLEKYFQTTEVQIPLYSYQPVVGFCGQADADFTKTAKEISIRIRHHLKYAINKTKNSPQPIQSTSKLRADLLYKLEKAEDISTNFIKRKKYRAGIKTDKSQHETTLEFHNNILNSQYIVCVRGGGNFSVRFYETLAMGRIPVFVNTDCLLPLADQINWKKHCVWVEVSEKNKIVEKVKAFHQQHTQESLFELMQANRKLWEEKMRIGRFFKCQLNAV
mgnify:CR=1 FL=1